MKLCIKMWTVVEPVGEAPVGEAPVGEEPI